jgi:hypothetical protein
LNLNSKLLSFGLGQYGETVKNMLTHPQRTDPDHMTNILIMTHIDEHNWMTHYLNYVQKVPIFTILTHTDPSAGPQPRAPLNA